MRSPEEIRAIKTLARALAIRVLGEKKKGSKSIGEFMINEADEIKLEIAQETAKALGHHDLVES